MQCIVVGCDVDSSSTFKGVTFHAFPTELTLREIWLQSLQMKDWKLAEGNAVCSNHFQKDDLYVSSNGHWSVREGAIPVVNVKNALEKDNWISPCNIKVCRICFATECNLYPITKYKNLDQAYQILTGLQIQNNDKLPLYLCTECSHRLLNCIQFRSRSIEANLILQELVLRNDYLTLEAIKSCNGYRLLCSKLGVTCTQTDYFDLEIKHEEQENIYTSDQRHIDDRSHIYAVNIVKVEKDDAVDHESTKDQDALYSTVCPPRIHEVIVPGIKLEKDDLYNQDSLNRQTYETAIEYNKDSHMLHDTNGIKIKVETLEITNQSHVDDTGHVPCNESLEGEDYPSDNVLLEELQRAKHKNQKPLKGHAENNSLIKKHAGKKLYSCDVCKKVFSQKYNLIPHLRIHSGAKPYFCEVCNKGFRLKYNLVSHLRKHSGEKPYVCGICKKSFILRNVLQTHLRIHTGEKPYACKLCDKVFSQRANLSAHIKIHSGEKPYSCDVCNKGFSQRCNLITHSRTHSGEKPYSCNVCMISFSRNYHLKSHLKIHTGEKPYSCDECKKAFNSHSNLQKHMTIHSGVKPYSCNICNKAFNRKGNLNTHIKTHSNEKPYSCVICNKAFRRKDQLKIHFKVHSSEKSIDVKMKDYMIELI